MELPLIVFDAELVNEVPIMISDEPEVNRIFRPGIFFFQYELIINMDKK